MKQHIRSCLTILPFRIFYFHMAPATNAGNENHGRGGNLVHIAGIMPSTTDHVKGRISQFISNIQHFLHQFLIKGGMFDSPSFFNPDRATSSSGNLFKVLSYILPGFKGQIIVSGAYIHSEMHLIRNNIPRVGIILNLSNCGDHIPAHPGRKFIHL